MSGLDGLEARLAAEVGWQSLEHLVTSPDGFGLDTATNVQRAYCWVLQDNTIPDKYWADENVQKTFGGVRPTARSPHMAREVLLLAGVRGAKTLICAAACVWFALKVRLDVGVGRYLKRGERPRVSLVAARADNAREAYNYVRGALTEQPKLQPLLRGEPKRDWLTVLHPSGREIDIKVVAMSAKQGVNLVSRWSAGVLFDEAPRMVADDAEGKVNLDGMVRGVRTRMLAGAPIMYIGSPVGAIGYVYKLFNDNFGKDPNRITVGRSRGSWLNPTHWTPERIESLKNNPLTYDDYLTDECAEFRDVETQMFSSVMVDKATRADPIVVPPDERRKYTAVMDPGTRGNAWALIVAETEDNVRFRVVLAHEWQGSAMQPLNTYQVLAETRDMLKPYGLTTVTTDQWASDPIRDIALTLGLGVSPMPFTAQNKYKRYKAVQTRLNSGLLELPPIENVRKDLLGVKQLVLGSGDLKIRLPETEDGRHCDFAAVLALLCGGYLEETDLERTEREAGELPTEDEEVFVTDNSFRARAQREWDGDDERGEAGDGW